MLRAALVALGLTTVAPGAIAQSAGVPICDDILRKTEICFNTKVPDNARGTLKGALDDLRKMMTELSSMPETKALAESTCGSFAETYKKTVFKTYGCAF